MRTWFMSPTGTITLTVLIAIGAGLALLSAIAAQGVSTRTIAASLLILSLIVFGFGGALFTGRAFWGWPIDNSHMSWERGFIIAAVLATVLGLALLEDLLRIAGDSGFARLGMMAYLVGAIVVVVAETASLGGRNFVYPQIVLYVVLAFLAQAVFGAALLRTGLVAAWAGWATVIWNVGWLLIMLIVRPNDIYFPVLHHVAPLIIGIALLVR
ncbi:MAG: hypothetical protein SF029_10950 [bacterium]|nr:hypothetical protein [bacterium]